MTELLRAHMAHLRRRNARPATMRDRRNNILRFERWLLDTYGVALGDVTEPMIERWQDEMTRRVAVSSQVTYVAHIRTFYAWAHEFGHLDHNPAARILRPRLPEQLPRPVPLPAFRTALRTATGDVKAMVVLAGYLGLRSGEIARLRREDVRREQIGTFITVHGKGGKERTTPLPDVIETFLRPWLTGRPGPVFVASTGRAMHSEEVTYAISTHFQALGMPFTAHQLRHRAATRLLQLTKDVRLVQQFLGHASLNTTAIYLEVTPEQAHGDVSLLAAELAADLGLLPPPPDPGGKSGLAAA